MANRTESCYEKTPQTCKFYAGDGKPLVRKVRILDENGDVKFVVKSHNEYKKIRQAMKAKKRKAFKERMAK